MRMLWEKIRGLSSDFWLRNLGALIILGFCLLGILSLRWERVAQRINNVAAYGTRYVALAENWFYDARSSYLYENPKKDTDLVIMGINDESLSKVARWPWSRRIQAQIVDKLHMAGAKTVFFDVFFSEPEKLCVAPNKKPTLEELIPPDDAFAAAIKRYQDDGGAVIIGFTVTDEKSQAMETPVDVLGTGDNILSGTLGPNGSEYLGHPFIEKYNFPVPALTSAGTHIGFLENIPDVDGVFRHASLFAQVDGFLVMSAGFSLFQHYFHESASDEIAAAPNNDPFYPYQIKYKRGDWPQYRTIPVNLLGEVRVRYTGARDAFEHYSTGDLVLADFNNPSVRETWEKRLQGKAVIVGSEAEGAHDLRHSPVSATMPGMYQHANVFHMLKENYFYKPAPLSNSLSLWAAGLGVLFVLLVSQLGMPAAELIGFIALVTAYFFIDRYYFIPNGYRISLFMVYTSIVGTYLWVNVLNVVKEIRERLKIRNAFTRYVSKDVVKEVLANPDKLRLGGEKRVITMLFSDIRSFTSISERLTPQELTYLLNTYMNRMTGILFENHGTLDKYIGDALVAFWGAPTDLPDHPVHALTAAIAMLEARPELNTHFREKGLPLIQVGLGINTGEVSVGNMGSDQIFAYTALGDHMNLASRLEGLTKHYGVELLFSEFTLEGLGEARSQFFYRPLDRVRVKGRDEPITIYEGLPSYHPLYGDRETLAAHTLAFKLYQSRKFAEAVEILSPFASKRDAQIQKLLDQCLAFAKTPPAQDWDGITTHKEK